MGENQRDAYKKTKNGLEKAKKTPKTTREKLRDLCECEEIVSDEEVMALGRIIREVGKVVDNVSSGDEVDEILEAEYHRLNDVLDLPVDTYSLTRIRPDLPACVKYGLRSGLTHQNMHKFSPVSRGLQGPAIAITAFATTALQKSRCWNEMIIDQIVEDGDTYYCESYKHLSTDDRRTLTVLDLDKDFVIQKSHRVYITIDDPVYAGTFRSGNPTDLHLVKALELFFERYDAGILTSPRLNVAIWKDSKYFNIFDGQSRKDNLLPTDDVSGGSAKLILVRDLTGVLFVILEKSDVKNEHFVLYGMEIRGIHRLPLTEDDPEEPEKSIGKPRRRPSGYKIQDKYRALVQGSFHLMHELIPEVLRGHGHLVIALTALIYSRLVNASKWTTAMIDLIFNQAHIYLVDLVRVLEKKFDENFELKIDDVMGDVIIGVYAAKVKVQVNVVPGQAKKGKATIDTGFRDFFVTNSSGILEIKKKFYAVWKEGEKYYFLDPFPCDDQGFRVDPSDSDNAERYKKTLACVTMNSSVNELIETILENTGNKEKDPFVLHGLTVLYVKTGSTSGGSFDTVIYREKNTNRKPFLPVSSPLEEPDDCKIVMDTVPRLRPDAEKVKIAFTQYPEPMKNIEVYMMKEDEPTTFVEGDSILESKQKVAKLGEKPVGQLTSNIDDKVKYIKGYCIRNSHRMTLHGSKNCLAEEFDERSRGRQGAAVALTAIAYAKIKNSASWRNVDIDQILRVGNQAHSGIVSWISQGSPEVASTNEGEAEEEDEEDEEEEEQGEEGDDEEEEGEEDDAEGGGKSKVFKRNLKPTPSHVDVSMLPDRTKLGENEVRFKKKMSVVEGNADPLANLGEAVEHYFKKYNQVILENNKLMYGIWKQDDKYFVLNPYGSDEEGWRLRDYPASLIVTDSLNELTDLFHGILEYNDRIFFLHFVAIESIQPGNKFTAPVEIEIPGNDTIEKYQTRFLPVTDEDLFVSQTESELKATTVVETVVEVNKGKEEVDEDEDDNDDEEDDEENDDQDEEDEEGKDDEGKGLEEESTDVEKPLVDPLLEIDEQEHSDAPNQLNLSLLTGGVNIEEDEIPDEESKETVMYERLKYSHPPPYVLPPKKVLCVLIEAKKASKSTHSLISRFSIDSKLAIEAATNLPAMIAAKEAAVATVTSYSNDEEKPSKMIKLLPKKYLFSRIPPTGFTPFRAINDKFIQDQDLDKTVEESCRKNKVKKALEEFVFVNIPEDPSGIRITPEIIPLGPTIKTPAPKKRLKLCTDHPKSQKCKISDAEKNDALLEQILCNTEEVLFDMIFQNSARKNIVSDDEDAKSENENQENSVEKKEMVNSAVRIESSDEELSNEPAIPETLGFFETEDNVGIIEGNMCLENRGQVEEYHFKPCFFAAILCILAKIQIDINNFHEGIIDQVIFASDKIYQRAGKLRYMLLRWFRNIVILDAMYNCVLKQSVYADPKNWENDNLSRIIETYLLKNQTGILVFSNASYAFWNSNGKYYMFDPYACDDKGRAIDDGFACLLEFCELKDMIKRIKDNNGFSDENPYRIYSLSIAHMESIMQKKEARKKGKQCSQNLSEESIPEDLSVNSIKSYEVLEPRQELSMIELVEWVVNDDNFINKFDTTVSGFTGLQNFQASALEVLVVENDITRPILAPFKKLKRGRTARTLDDDILNPLDPPRKKPYDRKFREHTCLGESIDLCVMAWSCVHDPTLWGVKTIRGIYEASKELTFDSLLAAVDSTVTEMIDGLLSEFSIANYSFRCVLAPLHHGTLYAKRGWNLAMSLKKLFEITIYSGAIIVCGKSHIGVMKRGVNYYAWWTIPMTKNLRIITSEVFEDFLKLIVKTIDTREEKPFVMRIVTISYAKKLDPDCSDMVGFYEPMVPATSLAQIHRKSFRPYDVEAMFRPTIPSSKPVFILGTVALRNWDTLIEPKVKRCYFVALLSVMIKRDIIQSPIPAMIDKVVEIAESLYKDFDEPKYHTEHILRNVTIMNRIFDFRDCVSSLFCFKINQSTSKNDFFSLVRKQLRRHFKKHTDGIIQFSNCCYGFWYSRSTKAYYYLDPYQCNLKGHRVNKGGNACLCVFSTICQMTRNMCMNRFEDTTGFFIHRLHVESINVPPYEKFQEDPMWVYLDYHWSFSHSSTKSKNKVRQTRRKKKQVSKIEYDDGCKEFDKQEDARPTWNYYTIEVPNLIYSVWGTIGCYDSRFSNRAGKNQAAISIAILAMQYICHPSKWSAAILDSAVICGDSYYTESLKSSTKRGSKFTNQFNLKSCFKIFPHVWIIEFLSNICGILYGQREIPNLVKTLKLGFQYSSSLVLECDNVTISILSAEDCFYVVDSCWTGPPLFDRNHGAIYALRCRNMRALVYVVTKILNTNQRLEFRVTPVIFNFDQETCKNADKRDTVKSTRKTILTETLGRKPGIADAHEIPVCGAVTVPDEDTFLSYRTNIGIGMIRGKEFEISSIPSPIPQMNNDSFNNILISTAWHLNVGQSSSKKRSPQDINRSKIQQVPQDHPIIKNWKIEPRNTSSITEKIQLCDEYPKTIDFAAGKFNIPGSTKIFTRRKLPKEISLTRKLDCMRSKSFLLDDSRREFERWTKVMADETYKTYEHRTILDYLEEKTVDDDESSPNPE